MASRRVTAAGFFFSQWTPAARLADAVVPGPNAGAQFGESTANSHAAKLCNLRHAHDATTTAPERQQSRKQTSLPLVESRDQPIDRRMVPARLAGRRIEAIRTRALVNRTLRLEVCHDCSRLP
jgi:hypothetical protein